MITEQARAIEIVRPLLDESVSELIEDTIQRSTDVTRPFLIDCFAYVRALIDENGMQIADIVATCLMTGEGFTNVLIYTVADERTVMFVSVLPAPKEHVVQFLAEHGFRGEDPPDAYGKWLNFIGDGYSYEQFPRQLHLVFYCDDGVILPRLGTIVDTQELYGTENRWFYAFPYEFSDSSVRS